jgi:hypothetical protein
VEDGNVLVLKRGGRSERHQRCGTLRKDPKLSGRRDMEQHFSLQQKRTNESNNVIKAKALEEHCEGSVVHGGFKRATYGGPLQVSSAGVCAAFQPYKTTTVALRLLRRTIRRCR